MLWVHKTSSPVLGEKGEPRFSEKIPSTSLTGSAKESQVSREKGRAWQTDCLLLADTTQEMKSSL